MKLVCKTRLGTTVAALALALMATTAQAETVKITILGVGDMPLFDGVGDRGGYARLNAVARAEREANPNFIYLLDGDLISPSLLSGLDKGANTIALTSIVPFDLAVPGNHEFDFGQDVFKARVAEAKYPWGAVNLTDAAGQPIAGVGGIIVKQYGSLKVALVPVTQDSAGETSSLGDWKVAPSADSAIAAAKDARKAGADLVIGVIHAAHVDDQKIYASHAFDVFVSGDDHDYILAYDGISVYAETFTDAQKLSLIDLAVDVQEKDGKRSVKWYPTFRTIDTAEVLPDPETQKVVDGYKDKLNADLATVIGTTEGPLDSRRNIVRKQESAMGNLIADTIKAATGADIAIVNGGGIRADKQYAAGATLTRKDILSELPFGNTTSLIEIKGADLLAALENGVSQVENGAGRFPQVSAGTKIVYDAAAAPGKRLVTVEIDGKAVDPEASYKLATNDFMLSGGDGYTSLAKGKVLVDGKGGKLLATEVIDYIAAHKTVEAKLEGRIAAK